MAFTPNDSTALPKHADLAPDVWQQHAHQYQAGAADKTSAAGRETAEKHLQPMRLDDHQGKAKVEKQYGVQVKENNGKYEYHCQENGKDKVLFSTDASPKGLEEAGKKLDGLVQAKEKELEAKYPGVTFAQKGEDLGKSRKSTDTEAEGTGPTVHARNPSLKELAGVEAALKHSDPSFRSADGSKLHIQFPGSPMVEGQKGDSASYSRPDPDKPGSPAILNVDMRSAEHSAATEEDVTQRRSDRNSIESCVTHELAHAAEHNVDGLDKDVPYKSESGWVPLKKPPTSRNDYAMQGKDGFLYQPIQTRDAKGHQTVEWAKMEGHAGYNEKGEYKGLYIGKDGKPVDLQSPKDVLDKGSHIDNNTMRDTAQVKPSTRYFDNPEEMMAEALTDYRMNPASRARLQTESPQLYQAAKHLDQLELDKMYGQGKKVRLPDGTVGDASAADAIE